MSGAGGRVNKLHPPPEIMFKENLPGYLVSTTVSVYSFFLFVKAKLRSMCICSIRFP